MGRKEKPMLVEQEGSSTMGQIMRQKRRDKGFSLTKMAGYTGYSLSYLSGVENGYVLPSSDLVKAYEQQLNLRTGDLENSIRSLPLTQELPSYHYLDLLKQGVNAWNRWREEHIQEQPSLLHASLHGVDLSGVNFSHAVLDYADLSSTNLNHANLHNASLHKADVSEADLTEANVSEAQLSGANISETKLYKTDFTRARIARTIFGAIDLRSVIGLETIVHLEPSYIDIRTIYRSYGKIPDVFLRGSGIPASFIEYRYALAVEPIEYYSCFLSYTHENEDFARLLNADLQRNGIRCWFAPEDLRPGDNFTKSIDSAIRSSNKVLLVLSKSSIDSSWIKLEVEAALEKEMRGQQSTIIPIRLDNEVMESSKAWITSLRRTRHIGDFTGWKIHSEYNEALNLLLRTLKA